MKKSLIVLSIALAIQGTSSNVYALTKEEVQAKMPGSPITSVKPVKDFPGIYELIVGKNTIFYINENADRLLIGHVFRLADRVDETQLRIDSLSKVDFNSLPKNQAIKFVKGDGSREFAVFTDPMCPFCHRLETALQSVDNYTMYVFPMPLASLHPSAPKIAEQIWCSGNQKQAWTEYLLSKKQPTGKTGCANPIQANVSLGQQLGISGTPALIGKNGNIKPGFMPSAKLDQWLSSVQ